MRVRLRPTPGPGREPLTTGRASVPPEAYSQIWNVIDRVDAVKQHDDHKEENSEGEIVQERIAYHIALSYGLRSSAVAHARDPLNDRQALINDVVAAIDVKSFTGDEPGGVVCKECSRNADVVDANEAAGGSLALRFFEQFVELRNS
jgi:hypothetical protein